MTAFQEGMRRRLRPLLGKACLACVVIGVVTALVGCGSSQTTVATILHTSPGLPTTTGAASAPTEPGGPLHEVGTMTQTDNKGTAVHLQYTLGPLGYSPAGTPSTVVLEACHENYTTTIAQAAYSRGQMTVSYTEGSLPADIALGADGAVSGTSTATKWEGAVAYDVEGQWKCPANEEAGTSVIFQPGETKTFPMWVLSGGLSNAQPRFSPAVMDGWEFTGVTVGNSPMEVTTSGPNAGRCESKDVLMLYAKLPFSIEVEGFGTEGTMVACRAVGG